MRTKLKQLTITIAALFMVVAVNPLLQGQVTNGVFLSGASPYGSTYAQWSAAWWRWNFSLPTTNSPIQDTAPISTGQGGPVWFIGGTFGLGGNQSRIRSGSVPEGAALLIGIMESWADDANCPVPDGYTTAQLRSLAASAQDPAFAMSCTIDGLNTVDLNGTPNAYRVQSPVFNYTAPGVHNYLYDLFGATCYFNPGGNYAINGAVADGVYLMVAPLSPGAHTIHFSGSYPVTIFPFTVIYVQDITCNLTVVATPALAMSVQGAQLILSWPQAASWFVLETSSSLSPPNWVPAGFPVQPAGNLNQVSVPIGNGSQFFRLKQI